MHVFSMKANSVEIIDETKMTHIFSREEKTEYFLQNVSISEYKVAMSILMNTNRFYTICFSTSIYIDPMRCSANAQYYLKRS